MGCWVQCVDESLSNWESQLNSWGNSTEHGLVINEKFVYDFSKARHGAYNTLTQILPQKRFFKNFFFHTKKPSKSIYTL